MKAEDLGVIYDEAELLALQATIEAAPVAMTNGYDVWAVADMPELPDMRKNVRVRLLPIAGKGEVHG